MNVLLDLDGTLTDPREGIVACIKHGLASLGESCPPDSELERFIGPPLHDTFRTLLGRDVTRVEAAIQAYRERFRTVGMFENKVYPGIPEALGRLRLAGAKLYLATSKPLVFAGKILAHFGLARDFDGVFGSELGGALSNKGELIAHALATAGLRAADTLMVGDREHDVHGALRNGVRPVGVLWGYGSKAELQAAGADWLLSRPAELAGLSI